MTGPRFEERSDGGHYSRWSEWRSEDDWGPIAAAVLFLIILAGLIIYGSTNLIKASVLESSTMGQSILVLVRSQSCDRPGSCLTVC